MTINQSLQQIKSIFDSYIEKDSPVIRVSKEGTIFTDEFYEKVIRELKVDRKNAVKNSNDFIKYLNEKTLESTPKRVD